MALEQKIHSYYLLNFFRFHMPAIDCFIVEQINLGRTEASDIFLANFPATLIYTFSNNNNFTIRNLLLTNKK